MEDPDQMPAERDPDLRASILEAYRAYDKGRLEPLEACHWIGRAEPSWLQERLRYVAELDAQRQRELIKEEAKLQVEAVKRQLHNNRGAGRKAKRRAEIIQRLRAEIGAGHVTLGQLKENPGKWAKVSGYHHQTFAAAVAVLLKERDNP